MDNIKDRQFYWEVKQFFNGKPENNVPSQPKPSLKDAVSGVLKENNPYKQTTFSNNQTSVNAAQNAIQGLGAMDAANKPSCVAYTKNAIKNPFNLNEGFWDIAGGIKKKIDDYTGKTERDAAESKANSAATEQRLNAEDARKKEIYQAANNRDKAFAGRWDAVGRVGDTINKIANLADSGQMTDATNSNANKNPLNTLGGKRTDTYDLYSRKKISSKGEGLLDLSIEMRQQNASLNPVASAQTTRPPVASSTTPVQGQSQAPDAQTKAPVQGQPQSLPAKNQPTATSTTPYKRQYVSSEPEGQPQRGPGGGVIADQSKFTYKASENPEAYKGMDDRRALGQVPMGGEVVGPNGIQKPGTSPFVKSLQDTIRKSAPQNTQFTPSAGQYRNRGSSNMGMATRPNRPEAMTLQSAMAQQNQQATRSALGQMGAVQGTPASSTGFQGSVLPPIGQLSSMGTQKENEFKYSRGSRLA